MTFNTLRLGATAFAFFALVSSSALARASDHLTEAQKAYAAVDYETTHREARAALEQGGNDHARTSELYVLLATAAAALDRAEEARVAFSYALAASPGLKLDRDLSPKMRAPYQEARGNATSADGQPPLRLELVRKKRELELTLRDQLHVAGSVELWTRAGERQSFSRQRFEPAQVRRVPIASGAELQYYLRVLDLQSNVLFESGTSDEPHHLPGEQRRASSLPARNDREGSRTAYVVAAGGLSVLGLAAGGVATALFLRREDAARDWNSPRCEQPGATRREQCAGVDERRRDAERLGIGFAVGSGALLASGLATWLLAPSAPSGTEVSVEPSAQGMLLRLSTAL